jgi:hypothetical protein
LDLKNPKTFNEHLMCLKLNRYTDNALVTQCADKYEVRNYITKCGCEQLLIPLLGVWKYPDDIPFDTLPDVKDAVWVSPKLVAEVEYVEITKDARLRQPRFIGLRSDKDAKNVVLEEK